MAKLYRKLFRSPYFLLFTLSILQLYLRRFLIESNSTTPIDQWLIANNTITLLINNAFLLFQVKKIGVLKNIRDTILLRIGKSEFCFQLYKLSFKGLLLYFSLTYIILTVICFDTLSIIPIFAFFIMLNIILFFMYEVLFNYMIVNKMNTLYIVIPFIVNILFHYVIVPILFYQ